MLHKVFSPHNSHQVMWQRKNIPFKEIFNQNRVRGSITDPVAQSAHPWSMRTASWLIQLIQWEPSYFARCSNLVPLHVCPIEVYAPRSYIMWPFIFIIVHQSLIYHRANHPSAFSKILQLLGVMGQDSSMRPVGVAYRGWNFIHTTRRIDSPKSSITSQHLICSPFDKVSLDSFNDEYATYQSILESWQRRRGLVHFSYHRWGIRFTSAKI